MNKAKIPHRFMDNRIPAGWYTATQVARKLGVSPSSVKRWRVGGDQDALPSGVMPMGEVEVNLYNEDDITRLFAYRDMKKAKVGRPKGYKKEKP